MEKFVPFMQKMYQLQANIRKKGTWILVVVLKLMVRKPECFSEGSARRKRKPAEG
ncbi:MAG: hypothetical protein ABIJ16_10025 [Bacteroidota bacterium]